MVGNTAEFLFAIFIIFTINNDSFKESISGWMWKCKCDLAYGLIISLKELREYQVCLKNSLLTKFEYYRSTSGSWSGDRWR